MASSSSEAPKEDQDNVDACFIKAIEYVNKAHQLLLSPAPEAARRLARVSVDLSMVHRQASELVDTSMIFAKLARSPGAPVLPPGLYKDLENCESLLAAQKQGHQITGSGYHLRPPLAPPQALPQAPPQAISWAKVAAARPEDNGKGKSRTLHGHAASNTSNPPASTKRYTVPQDGESVASQQRVVFVKGCRVGMGLHDIAKQIAQGPVMSISIERDPDRPSLIVGIIFFDADHARAFLQRNKIFAQERGYCLYGAGVTVVPGPLWPEDDEIRAMAGVTFHGRERRRLIFSGAGLFHHLSGTAFHEDLAAIAGDDNIELIWLYNTGNATVVFASTRVARAVLTELRKKALHGGTYEGVSITFATDPCEKELNLVTSIPSIAAVKMY